VSQGPREHELIHDIRNRLTVARANVEAFIDGKMTPTPTRLKGVLQSLNQLEELLNELRASQQSSDAGTRPVEIDVCDVLTREYAALEAVAAEKGVSLLVGRCPVKGEACGHFIGDPVRIGQIVSNVLLNAVRYTPSGGVVSVDCSHRSGQLEISVADSGPGVAPEETDKIFERGFRGSAGGGAPGSGFGLAIAKEFVEAHGGTIEVAKSSNKGARFVVRLPGTAVATPGKIT
jgi:two-component system sensor histidine kinase BaeS